jgi:hypothetical protein
MGSVTRPKCLELELELELTLDSEAPAAIGPYVQVSLTLSG